MTLTFTPIPAEKLDEHWPALSHYLVGALEYSYGDLTFEGTKKRLYAGDELLIACFDGDKLLSCCTLMIIDFESGKKVLQIVMAGGTNVDLWIDEGVNVLINIAKEYECTHIRACGRSGWERVLPYLKKIRTIYECEV